jgi:hypothetical protein
VHGSPIRGEWTSIRSPTESSACSAAISTFERLPWLGHVSDTGGSSPTRSRGPEVRITGRSGSAQIYPPLTRLRDQEGSIISNQELSHGSRPRKSHSRARLRDLGRIWLCPRPSRSALACGRAGTPGGIDGRARLPIRPAKGAPVACTFESRQEPDIVGCEWVGAK